MSQALNPINTQTLFDLVLTHDKVQDFLDQLAVLSTRIMSPALVECGITYQDARRTTTLASSSPDVDIMDERQYDNEAGPCLSSIKTGTITVVDDATTDHRWPAYLHSVADYGYQSMMGVPLLLARDGHSGSACINFYATDPFVFTPQRQAVARNFAATAATSLTLALRLSSSAAINDDLHLAVDSRSPINVAVGIIMAQNTCTQDEAFTILRSASNNQNVKVRVLAQQIINRASVTADQ